MSELKPCPFCGAQAEVVTGNLYVDKTVKVRCRKCRAGTFFELIDHPSIDPRTGKLNEQTRYTEEQATERVAEAWNRRVGDDLSERMVDDGK